MQKDNFEFTDKELKDMSLKELQMIIGAGISGEYRKKVIMLLIEKKRQVSKI